jgi:hypothetical protein
MNLWEVKLPSEMLQTCLFIMQRHSALNLALYLGI